MSFDLITGNLFFFLISSGSLVDFCSCSCLLFVFLLITLKCFWLCLITFSSSKFNVSCWVFIIFSLCVLGYRHNWLASNIRENMKKRTGSERPSARAKERQGRLLFGCQPHQWQTKGNTSTLHISRFWTLSKLKEGCCSFPYLRMVRLSMPSEVVWAKGAAGTIGMTVKRIPVTIHMTSKGTITCTVWWSELCFRSKQSLFSMIRWQIELEAIILTDEKHLQGVWHICLSSQYLITHLAPLVCTCLIEININHVIKYQVFHLSFTGKQIILFPLNFEGTQCWPYLGSKWSG